MKTPPQKKKVKENNSWNYRIIVTREPDELVFNIHEVYYTNDVPTSWSENPIYAQGSTKSALMDDLHFMLHAIQRPVLEIVDNKLVERRLSLTQKKI